MTTSLIDPALDMNYIHRTYEHGVCDVHITWLFSGAERAGGQPCMVLMVPNERLDNPEFEKIVITMDNAWRWSSELWGPEWGEPNVMFLAAGYAEILRLNTNDINTLIGIVSVIETHLTDILTLPPAPPLEMAKTGVTLTASDLGGTVLNEVDL